MQRLSGRRKLGLFGEQQEGQCSRSRVIQGESGGHGGGRNFQGQILKGLWAIVKTWIPLEG